MDKKLKTIIEMLENKGYVSGIVATSSVVHATPAAFYAHSDDRYDYKNISHSWFYLDFKPGTQIDFTRE